MIEETLSAWRRGGVYDQLDFGFHRYSTDEQWLVPHFEKMLYDQALLLKCYLAAWQITGRDLYSRVVEEIIEYVTRDLRAPEGGFYSVEDADSEGVEGKYYVWTTQEVRKILAGPKAEELDSGRTADQEKTGPG